MSTGETAVSQSSSEATESRTYVGTRKPDAPLCRSYQVEANGSPLDPRVDLHEHSSDGLAWGYAGSGPAQLALALLADALDDETALEHYQRFKRHVVAELPDDGWRLSEADIREWMAEVD